MAGSLFSPLPSRPPFPAHRSSFSGVSLPCRAIGFAAVAHTHRALAVRAETAQSPAPKSPGGEEVVVVVATEEDAKKVEMSESDPELPDVHVCARVVLEPVALLLLPIYKTILRVENEVDQTADIVKNVAIFVAVVSLKVSEPLPDDFWLKNIALEVHKIADLLAKDASLARVYVKKVHNIVGKTVPAKRGEEGSQPARKEAEV
ncbi:hypothetical protein Cni_G06352 [Canna indica]|uniref:Uncharacterized protein n=1 Tax=Canna indica TaxID=4628 RepID=A0AAQ3Q6F5_9LILI|nr:hypothetical protein Cni_G06352 [Canna indica]